MVGGTVVALVVVVHVVVFLVVVVVPVVLVGASVVDFGVVVGARVEVGDGVVVRAGELVVFFVVEDPPFPAELSVVVVRAVVTAGFVVAENVVDAQVSLVVGGATVAASMETLFTNTPNVGTLVAVELRPPGSPETTPGALIFITEVGASVFK